MCKRTWRGRKRRNGGEVPMGGSSAGIEVSGANTVVSRASALLDGHTPTHFGTCTLGRSMKPNQYISGTRTCSCLNTSPPCCLLLTITPVFTPGFPALQRHQQLPKVTPAVLLVAAVASPSLGCCWPSLCGTWSTCTSSRPSPRTSQLQHPPRSDRCVRNDE